MRWEALVKKRARGIKARTDAMWMVSEGICPPGRKNYIPPKKLKLVEGASE
jgi:hypothetical protein